MNEQQIAWAVNHRMGYRDVAQAKQLIKATLRGLGGFLQDPEIDDLVGHVASSYIEYMRATPFHPQWTEADFFEQVGRSCQIRTSLAVEGVCAVCQVIAEALQPSMLVALRSYLPKELSNLFTPAPPTRSEGFAMLQEGTLANGRPGSRQPLCDAKPLSSLQRHSVMEQNPHGETKLSSYEGPSAQHHRQSLASYSGS